MTRRILGYTLLGLPLAISLSANSFAAMGNSPSIYGAMPHDVATAQSLSLFNGQAAAVYYNPAALAKSKRGQLTGGIFHAEHSLEAETVRGTDAAPERDGSVLQDTPSQQLSAGIVIDGSKMTSFNHPIYFGLMLSAEKFIKQLLVIDSETTSQGQFLRYGRQPLLLNLGVGTQIWRGLDFGASVLVTFQNEADLYVRSDLAGNTKDERLGVDAGPSFQPSFGMNFNLGETFCPESDCWMDGLELAAAYRFSSKTKINVGAETEINGVINDPGLQLDIFTIDSFQPTTITMGMQYSWDYVKLGFTAEYQDWDELRHEFKGDTVRDQANAQFKSIVIPRIGATWEIVDRITLKTGISYEESPLKEGGTLNANYLDTDRVVFGVGFASYEPYLPLMAYPVLVELGYQYHHLISREFDLFSNNPDTNPNAPAQTYYETVEAKGGVHVISGAVTVQF